MLAACWFAVLKAGGIAVTTMPLLRARELVQICNKTEAQFALCDVRLAEELELARPLIPSLKGIRFFAANGSGDLDLSMSLQSPTFPNVMTSHDDVAIIAFTSGTTGPAKATMHFHRDLLAACDSYPAEVLRSGWRISLREAHPWVLRTVLAPCCFFPCGGEARPFCWNKSIPRLCCRPFNSSG
jgi:2-aminobenzoate-CoA ligase